MSPTPNSEVKAVRAYDSIVHSIMRKWVIAKSMASFFNGTSIPTCPEGREAIVQGYRSKSHQDPYLLPPTEPEVLVVWITVFNFGKICVRLIMTKEE